MKKLLIAVLGVVSLSACASVKQEPVAAGQCPAPVARKVAFNPEQYKAYDVKGTARINGRLCTVGLNGRKKCPEGQMVTVNPVTDYSTEWYERHWVNREPLEKPDARALSYNRIVKTEKGGWFTITGLPAGEYYVAAQICPCTGFTDKERPNYRFERFGTTVKMKRSVKADLKKVSE